MFTNEMLWEFLKNAGFAMTTLDSEDVRIILGDDKDPHGVVGDDWGEDDDATMWVFGTVTIHNDIELRIENDAELDAECDGPQIVTLPLTDPDCFSKLVKLFRDWQNTGAWPGKKRNDWEATAEELDALDAEE